MGIRFMNAVIFSSGSLGIGVGVFSVFKTLVTTTFGFFTSLLSHRVIDARGFSVKVGPGELLPETPNSKKVILG